MRRLPCEARSRGPSRTHCACCARFVQTSAPSPEHEARCARGHAPCASRRRRGAAPATRPGRCEQQWAGSTGHSPRVGVSASRITTGVCKDAAGWRAQRLCGGEEHRGRGRARSADRALTWERLVERSERRERSEFRDPASEPTQRARTRNRPCGLFRAWRAPWRLQAPGHTAQSDHREDRRSEAKNAARPRLCAPKATHELRSNKRPPCAANGSPCEPSLMLRPRRAPALADVPATIDAFQVRVKAPQPRDMLEHLG